MGHVAARAATPAEESDAVASVRTTLVAGIALVAPAGLVWLLVRAVTGGGPPPVDVGSREVVDALGLFV
jgi:hypothetical protein